MPAVEFRLSANREKLGGVASVEWAERSEIMRACPGAPHDCEIIGKIPFSPTPEPPEA